MRKTVLLALFMCLFIRPGSAQGDKFKALFIFNFTKHIEWGGDYKNGDFVIAVLGNSEVYNSLLSIGQTKTVGSQPIKVIKVNSPAEVVKCNIFYVPTNKSAEIDKVVDKFKNTSTLVVTDDTNACAKGSCINLQLVDGKQKFEISKANVQKQNLKVSTGLLNLGIAL